MRKLGAKPIEQEVPLIATQLWPLIAWSDWTPTVTQGVSVTATITYARYCLIGKTCRVAIRLAVTSAGTGGQPVVIGGQPAAIQPRYAGASHYALGVALVLRTGVANYAGILSAEGVTDWRIMPHGLTYWLGQDPSYALANGDVISAQAEYEIA